MSKPQTKDLAGDRSLEEALRFVTENTSGAFDDNFFRTLVRQLATTLQVRFAFISEFDGTDRLRVAALWEGADFAETFEYEIVGTPCEWVFKKGLCHYPSRLQEIFPKDRWLQQKGIHSYLAIPLYDSVGNPFGHLGVMHDAPMIDHLPRESILRIFAARATSELERKHRENYFRAQATRLAQANQHLSALHSVTVAANQSLELEAVLQEVIKKIIEIFQFDGMKVYLLNPQTNLLQIQSSYEGHPQRLNTYRVSLPLRGLVQLVANSGDPIIFEDVETDSRYPQLSVSKVAYEIGTRFLSMFPIRASSGFVGVIVCVGQLPRSLTGDEIQLIEAMASQVGIAVEKAQLYEETKQQALQQKKDVIDLRQAKNQIERQIHRLDILSEVNQAINSTLDLLPLLDLLLDKIDLLLPYSAATLRLLNSETGEFEPIACRNLDIDDWKAGSGRGLIRDIMETKAPVMSIDVQADERARDPEFFRKHGLISFLAVPLIAKGEILGILSFYTRKKREFSKDEFEFLTTLASHAATAIHNSQLHNQLQKRTHEISAQYHVTASANKSLDLNTVLNAVTIEVTKIFSFDATRIFVKSPLTNTLELRAFKDLQPGPDLKFRGGRRFASVVLKMGKPLIMDDLHRDPRYLRFSKHQTALKRGFRFYAAFPVKVRARTVGVIMCIGLTPRRLRVEEIQLMESMAIQVGAAVEKAQLYEKTKRQASQLEKDIVKRRESEQELWGFSERLRIMHHIDQAILLARSPREIADVTLHQLRELIPFFRASVIIFNLGENEATILAVNFDGNTQFGVGTRISLKKFLGLKAMQQGKVYVRKEILHRSKQPKNVQGLYAEGMRSFVNIPLISRGELVGTLNLVGDRAEAFNTRHIEVSKEVADSLAVAIQNATLYEEVERKTHELSSLVRINHDIAGLLSQDTLLPRIAEEAKTLLKADSFTFRLIEGESLVLKSHMGARLGAHSRLPLGKSLSGKLIRENRVLAINNIMDELSISPRHRRSLVKAGIRSYLGAPLQVGGRVIGIVNLYYKERKTFSHNEIHLIKAFAVQAAISIQNAQLFEQIQLGRERMQLLSRRLVETQELERRSIARELHDEIGQVLTGLKLTLEASRRLPPHRYQEKLIEAQSLINELMVRVRGLSLDLRPAMLDDLGLLPTLLWLFERFTSQTNLKVSLKHSGIKGRRFATEIETATFRILQEAVNNTARHAGVKKATVQLQATHGTLNLQVVDQGAGFDDTSATDTGRGSGLAGMRERVISLNGKFVVDSTPGIGTRIMAKLPLKETLKKERSGK